MKKFLIISTIALSFASPALAADKTPFKENHGFFVDANGIARYKLTTNAYETVVYPQSKACQASIKVADRFLDKKLSKKVKDQIKNVLFARAKYEFVKGEGAKKSSSAGNVYIHTNDADVINAIYCYEKAPSSVEYLKDENHRNKNNEKNAKATKKRNK